MVGVRSKKILVVNKNFKENVRPKPLLHKQTFENGSFKREKDIQYRDL